MYVITNKGVFIEKDTQEQEIEEKEIRLKKYEVIQGGLSTAGGEPPSLSGNWLRDLPMGTVFLISDKSKPRDFMLGLFRVVGKETKAVALQTTGSNDPIYVNPYRFCNQYELFETLAVLNTEDVPAEQEQEEEKKDDEGNRTTDV